MVDPLCLIHTTIFAPLHIPSGLVGTIPLPRRERVGVWVKAAQPPAGDLLQLCERLASWGNPVGRTIGDSPSLLGDTPRPLPGGFPGAPAFGASGCRDWSLPGELGVSPSPQTHPPRLGGSKGVDENGEYEIHDLTCWWGGPPIVGSGTRQPPQLWKRHSWAPVGKHPAPQRSTFCFVTLCYNGA